MKLEWFISNHGFSFLQSFETFWEGKRFRLIVAMICVPFQRGGVSHGKLKLESWDRERRRSLDTTDRHVAWSRLLAWRRDEEWEEEGLLWPPRTLREARKKPLAGLLDAFLGDMQARQKSPGTLHKYAVAMRNLSRECKWETLGDVSAASFCEWRRECGLRPKTSNDYGKRACDLPTQPTGSAGLEPGMGPFYRRRIGGSFAAPPGESAI
jgi:hypothetical protein